MFFIRFTARIFDSKLKISFPVEMLNKVFMLGRFPEMWVTAWQFFWEKIEEIE